MSSPSFFFSAPEMRPRTVWRCQPIALAISSMVAPSGRCSSPMTRACFEPARRRAEPPAGAEATGNWLKAAQRRCTAVLRSLNLATGAVPGSAFQIAAICAFDNPLVSISFADRTRNSSSEALAGAMGGRGMRAYRIDRFGGVDGVVLGSRNDPRPGSREILLRVRATSLNYRDLMVLKGGGRGPTKLGVVPLSDGAGEVAAVGDGVTRFAVGDQVIGCFHPRWFGGPIKPDYLTDRLGANLDGMLAEYAAVSEEAAVAMPSHLSFEEAATLPCAAVTAWVALTGHRRVTAGDTVLTQGTGGVSIFALQFARLLGAEVIGTTPSAAKAERLRALGAAAVIDYLDTPEWHEKVAELTGGRGVDCVVEIGGPDTLANSIKSLAVGGHISLIGSS